MPKIPDLVDVPSSVASDFLGVVVLAAFFAAFFEVDAAVLSAVVSVGGITGSMYVSRSFEKAMADVTQTTGVMTSINRTMTPAK